MDRITLRLPNGTEMVADSREMWGNAVDEPDPLVYWAAEPDTGAGRRTRDLSGRARLVGTLQSGRRTVLPLPGRGGSLILYSLAHREVLAAAPAPKEIP